MSDPERLRALALLEATHAFPVSYPVSVVALNAEPVRVAVRGAASAEGRRSVDGDWVETSSRQGRYVSWRFSVHCAAAEDVLRLYAALRAIEGVVTVI